MSRARVVQAQLTLEVFEQLSLMAAAEDRSLSKMVARLLDEALEARREPRRREAKR
jgi:predicted HicB family RNase H-like nuclease